MERDLIENQNDNSDLSESNEQAEQTDKSTKSAKKYGKLSKKNKALTGIIKKVVGGSKGGGWDANHNETFV